MEVSIMFKHTHSSTAHALCPTTCSCPLHHHKPMTLRKEAKILEHFANQRFGNESRDSFIKMIEEELEEGAPIQHLRYKIEFLDRLDPLQKRINLSEKKSVDQRFVKYLLSDSSPKNLKNFLSPEENGWLVTATAQTKETKKKPKTRKKAGPKKTEAKKTSTKKTAAKKTSTKKASTKKVTSKAKKGARTTTRTKKTKTK